jgi:UDP-N-acetylbacillosamine N-acetyltransferase
MKSIAIYGAGGHSKVVADIARKNGYHEIIYIDDKNTAFINFETFQKEYNNIPLVLGIGDNKIRENLYNKCKSSNINIETLIHPTSTLSNNVTIGEGTVIMANVVINADSYIGKGCILNTSCVIEHDNIINDFVHISPKVACAGKVQIGQSTHIGIGSSIIQNITIGSHSIIGAGSVVVEDIDSYTLAYGNPCKHIKGIN